MNNYEPFSPFHVPTDTDLVQSMKTTIRGILDSYHGDWDFLIELVQNAVDALEEKFDSKDAPTEKPRLDIVINYQTSTVQVSDNGIGMTPEIARRILAPSYTTKPYYDKKDRRSFRGHKGVGLTFLTFSTDRFRFATKKGEKFFAGEIHNGKTWAFAEDAGEPEPKVKPSEYHPDFLRACSSGSCFEVKLDGISRLGLSWLGWHQILRTQTAAGFFDINELHSWNKGAATRLQVVDANGSSLEPPEGLYSEFGLEYLFPHTLLTACDLDAFHVKRPARASVPASEKHKYEALYVHWDTDHIEKQLFDNGNIEHESDRYTHYLATKNYLPSLYALFTHSQRLWHDRLDSGLSSDRRRHFWRPGIQVVTHQMPTGEIIEISLPFRAGNKDRILLMIELEGVKPDYGRKGFKSEVNRFVQHLATQAVSYFLDNRELLKPTSIAHGDTSTDAVARADARRKEAMAFPDLGVSELRFKKEPQFENDVIALFSELIARNYIIGFDILSLSQVSQYDAIVNYRFTENPSQLLFDPAKNPFGLAKANIGKHDWEGKNLEYKKSLEDLISDIEDGTKEASQVHFVVCWDEGSLQQSGYELVDLTQPGNYQKRKFHGQTHSLELDTGAIPVFMLQNIVKEHTTKSS